MISTIGAIAAGGALGALARFSVNSLSVQWFGEEFPWGTLLINIVGCFLMGIAIGIFQNFWSPPEPLRNFMVAGVLSSFTTFSAFSLDVIQLLEREKYLHMSLYYLSSITLCVLSILLAVLFVKNLAA